MEENHYNCIYMYTNKINGKRYVGQTVDFNRRHKKHISDSYNEKRKYQYNVPFHCAIRKYGIENFKIQILAENIPTQEKMNEYEIFFIKRYNTLANNKKGYNISSGGSNGNPFAGKTEEEMNEWKQNMSKAQTGENNPMYGKHLSEETKQKMSEAKKGKFTGENNPMYGKYHTEESRQKISQAKKGKNAPQAKRIIQYNKQGNLIRVWDYAKQVTEELGINHGNIISCCKGKLKSAGGYIWRYAEELE